MRDNVFLGDRDGVRKPMQWSADRNAGFSRADFAQLYFPLIMGSATNNRVPLSQMNHFSEPVN